MIASHSNPGRFSPQALRRRRPSALATLLALTLAASPQLVQGQGAGPPPGMAPPTPKSPPIPKTFDERFSHQWSRARDVFAYMRCFEGSLSALRAGAMGQVPESWVMLCVKQDEEWRGVLAESSIESPAVNVRMQYVPPTGSPRRAPRGVADQGRITSASIDTQRVAAVSRAMRRALSVPMPGAGKYQFTPVVLPQEGFVEIWFMPAPQPPSRVVTGGDSIIQMAADGSRELGHGRSTPPIRTRSIETDGKEIVIDSNEERVPLVSELVVAEQALDVVPTVRIRTRQFETVLTRGSLVPRHTQR